MSGRHPNVGDTVYFIDYRGDESVKELGTVYAVSEFDGEIKVWLSEDLNEDHIEWFDGETSFDETTQRWIRD